MTKIVSQTLIYSIKFVQIGTKHLDLDKNPHVVRKFIYLVLFNKKSCLILYAYATYN